jgi:hypothetical protein
MSAVTDSNTETIYVELLDEGTFVIRPTKGERLSQFRYKLLPTPDYDPELETWRFMPGTVVDCELEEHDGDQVLVAKQSVA